MKYFKNENLLLFLFILSIYIIFSNGRITTSMDVDVLNYAKDFYESGSFGSDGALASGIVYSPHTEKFYPMEGFGVVVPYVITYGFSKIFGIESIFPVYMTNQILSAISVLFIFLTLKLLTCKRKSLFLALVYGLATPLFVHSKYLLPEPITMVMFSGAFYFYFKYFIGKGAQYNLLLSLLMGSLSLLCRPDAPAFLGLFSVMVLVKLIQSKERGKTYLLSIGGLAIGLILFSAINYSKFGSIIETGYTITRDVQIDGVLNKIEKSNKKREVVYEELKSLYEVDKESSATKEKYVEYETLNQTIKTQEKFFKDLERLQKEHDSVPNTIEKNSISEFLYGVVLSTIYPNRSILFLSPILLLLIPSMGSFFKRYKVEGISILAISLFYLALYSMRAPLSYAGSAAWGVRYLLPIYPLLFILASGKIPDKLSDNKLFKRALIGLFVISIGFQILGSSVNYQSVQMPLEYACKQKFGEKDMTWARESRKELMTTFRASLLLNNLYIVRDKPPIVLKPFLGEDIYKRLEVSNSIKGGVNDWFFLDIVKGNREESRSLFILLLLTAIVVAGHSGYTIYNLVVKGENRER